MEVRKKLKPGEHGTKRLLDKYGEKLVCVRYRYDDKKHKRYTTVEIIVDQKNYFPLSKELIQILGTNDILPNTIVKLRILYRDTETRNRVIEAGGFWDDESKHWHLEIDKIIKLGLEKRIIKDA